MAPQDRLAQVSSHLNYPQGMLAGQTAIITGSGQGIGAECARLFANEGAKVVVCDVDASASIPNSLSHVTSAHTDSPASKVQKLTYCSTSQRKAKKSPMPSTKYTQTVPSPSPVT